MPPVIQTAAGERVIKTTYIPLAVYRAIEHERTKETRISFTMTVNELLREALIARGVDIDEFETQALLLESRE